MYTGNPKAPWAQALAITGTRIDAVGSDQEILSRRSAKTEVIDLQGRTVRVRPMRDSLTTALERLKPARKPIWRCFPKIFSQ
jgi:hypothetical protein